MIIIIVENVLESVSTWTTTAMNCVNFPTTGKYAGMVKINGVGISKIVFFMFIAPIKRGRFKRMLPLSYTNTGINIHFSNLGCSA